MSLEKHSPNHHPNTPHQTIYNQLRGSYTDSAFYRKPNNPPETHNNKQWPKQSTFQHKTTPAGGRELPQMAYSTLNPSNYSASYGRELEQDEYEALAVFELNREKQKNRILQERLKNKELYILNLKEINNQLTDAFEKCQVELQHQKKKSNQNVDVREYLEEINQLKHLVIRLEDKINQYEKKQNRRYSSLRQDSAQMQNQKRSINEFVGEHNSARSNKREKRSKTVANQQDSSPQFKKIDMIQEHIVKFPNRITNFITQFLSMVEWFSSEAQNAKGQDTVNVKKRLKIGWKWIKQTVVEWNKYKNQYEIESSTRTKLKRMLQGESKFDQKKMVELVRQLIN